MKKLVFFCVMFVAFAVTSFAAIKSPDDSVEEFGKEELSPVDPEYEWSEIDSKQIKVGLKAQSLQLESKQLDGFAYSVTELPFDVEQFHEFLFGFTLSLKGFKPIDYVKSEKLAAKLNKGRDANGGNQMIGSFGMLFDYQDIHNYKAIAIFQKSFQYYVVKDGVTSLIKSGPVKYKGDTLKLIMKRKNGGVEFLLNGIEVCKLRKIAMTSSFFGVFINGQGKAEMKSFVMDVTEQEDTNQSTSDV